MLFRVNVGMNEMCCEDWEVRRVVVLCGKHNSLRTG